MLLTNHNYSKNSGNNKNKSSHLKSRSIEIERSHRGLSEEPDNNRNTHINAINQNNNIELQSNLLKRPTL